MFIHRRHHQHKFYKNGKFVVIQTFHGPKFLLLCSTYKVITTQCIIWMFKWNYTRAFSHKNRPLIVWKCQTLLPATSKEQITNPKTVTDPDPILGVKKIRSFFNRGIGFRVCALSRKIYGIQYRILLFFSYSTYLVFVLRKFKQPFLTKKSDIGSCNKNQITAPGNQ